jgi:hypothetical protein
MLPNPIGAPPGAWKNPAGSVTQKERLEQLTKPAEHSPPLWNVEQLETPHFPNNQPTESKGLASFSQAPPSIKITDQPARPAFPPTRAPRLS